LRHEHLPPHVRQFHPLQKDKSARGQGSIIMYQSDI
jgi:hypothetical protein